MHRGVLVALLGVMAVISVVAWLLNPAVGAEQNPNAVLTFDWNNPGQSPQVDDVVERVRVVAEHNAKLLSQLSPALVRHTALDEDGPQRTNRKNKGDALQAIVFKDYGDGMWNLWGPMGVREAYVYKASDLSVNVYVEGTDEYDDAIIAYWPEDRDPPETGGPRSAPDNIGVLTFDERFALK